MPVAPQRVHVRPAYRVLHSFCSIASCKDGAYPVANLINLSGTLYGTASYAGADCSSGENCGTVFAITMSGKAHVLHSFGGSGDGHYPDAGLLNVNGSLFGATGFGGGPECPRSGGCGTVFAIATSGTETVLYSFEGRKSRDGANPYAGLININGALYGTTAFGGAHDGSGTVFAIMTSGAERVVYSFKGGSGDGATPFAGLINVNGTLYGTTDEGGANGDGTVFSITPSGTETMLYSFKGGSGDGEYPRAGLIDVMGTLYGTTDEGGANDDGTVFSITPSGTETMLYSFKGGSGDGASPYAALLNVNGMLYGTTADGGTNGKGTVFSITPSGTETVLHSFAGGKRDGKSPVAGLLNVKGTLYGTTEYGGASDDGTVFSLSL
ncbi:MAG TPA: choice-of-anchor tandem repeat GloVer-containing protein [Candidatus Cybelea sp.]|nr:choice-of-anchor tandem repeat GloVer-containing protein [Candidatus Cybelea sp.]